MLCSSRIQIPRLGESQPSTAAMATTFDSPTSSPAVVPFHDDSFLCFDILAADVHVYGDGFPASPDPYAFCSDVPSPFGMPEANGGLHDDPFNAPPVDVDSGLVLSLPTMMGHEEGVLLRKWRQ